MKKIIFLIVTSFLTINVFSQGSGELTVYPAKNKIHHYHSPNNSGVIEKLTVKWNFFTLFGEPVIDGIFKWEAGYNEYTGGNTPANFLDYKDYVLLECEPLNQRINTLSILNIFYIAISPTVPRAGEGYGFNTPGSPSWNDVFINSLWGIRLGDDKYRLDIKYLPYKTPGDYAKAIWKAGFKVINAHLMRAGGLDADKKNNSSNDDFWNTPENTTTQKDLKQKEGSERIKQIANEGKDKYKALKNPYTLNVNNLDTVYVTEIQLINSLNSYFKNGTITLKSVNKGTINSTANDINIKLKLSEGLNTLRIALNGDDYNIRDSVKIYYDSNPLILYAYFDEIEKKYGYKNAEGHIKIYPKFNNAKHFSEGLGAIADENSKWGFINSLGNIVIEPAYSEVGKFSESLSAVRTDYNNWGYIDRHGKMILSNLKYDKVGEFVNGKAPVYWRTNDPIPEESESHKEENRLRRERGEPTIRHLILATPQTAHKAFINKNGYKY
jgi:hypothetical protein